MTNLAQLVPLPPVSSVNRGLSRLRESVMLELFGVPGDPPQPGETCGRLTNTKLLSLLQARRIANLQFAIRAPGVVLDLLEQVFADILRADPELFDKCRTNGSLCCRRIRNNGRSGPFSNHSWGMAIDLGFQPQGPGGFIAADPRGDGRTELGLLKLVPFFNARRFFWGGAFSGDSEDSMHFEVSEQLARSLFSPGAPGFHPTPPPDRPEPTELTHPLLRSDPVLQAVAAGNRILERSGERSASVGAIQDALNRLSEGNPQLAVNLGDRRQFQGFFGPQTERAVKRFQEASGLSVDGRIGEATIEALDKALNALPTGPVPNMMTGPVIEGPGGYLPPERARSLLGTIPIKEAEEIEAEDLGIFRDQSEIILKLPSGALFFESGMQTDADGSPRARQIDRFGQLETAFNFANQSGQARFVDAESVNYIVLPDNRTNESERFFRKMGFKLGDIAAVIHQGILQFALFADIGPSGKLGEGSVRLVQALGVDPFIDGQVRVGIDREVVYIVFPNSRPVSLTPDNVNDKVADAGLRLFKNLGGVVPGNQVPA
ncbi:MAG: peptidoglycan-binding domain 1 protein [Proteobacteria bacterium]|nr:peptidoglycan-binding domain 1 protein [Pseudomonadota bacterium]